MAEFNKLNWISSDQIVVASLGYPDGIDGNRCIIYNLTATIPGKGHGTRALEELRKKYSFIQAQEVADESGPSRKFWFAMVKKGLVDVLRDSHGVVWPIPTGDQAHLIHDEISQHAKDREVNR